MGEDVRDGEDTVVFVASGRKLAQVREAAAILHSAHGVGSRILNVTSYEMLWRDWDAFVSDPSAWEDDTRSYVLHDLFDDWLLNAPLILTGDHLPSACEWLPGALQRVRGHRFLGRATNRVDHLPHILHGVIGHVGGLLLPVHFLLGFA